MPDRILPSEFARQRLNLSELLNYNNPRMAEYRTCVGNVEEHDFAPTTDPSFVDIDLDYMRRYVENPPPPHHVEYERSLDYKKLLEYLRTHLTEEDIIIDLASGTNSLGQHLSKLGINYKAICGVDPWNYQDSHYIRHWRLSHKKEPRPVDPDTKEVIDPEMAIRNPKLYEIRDDALLFTARLKRNSFNFSVFGPSVIPYPWKGLLTEIVESTKPGGVIFGSRHGTIGSDFRFLDEDYPHQIKKIGDTEQGFYVFEKLK